MSKLGYISERNFNMCLMYTIINFEKSHFIKKNSFFFRTAALLHKVIMGYYGRRFFWTAAVILGAVLLHKVI